MPDAPVPTSAPPTVILKPGEADRVLSGHPWIYEGAILKISRPAGDGEVVQVKDHRQRFLGMGFHNSRSKIRVRMLSAERVEIDAAFLRARIEAALDVRRRHMPGATSYRVVNAESDFLSGLIVDRYEDVLVLQTSSLGMDQRKAEIVGILRDLLSPRAILERNEMASRKFEGLPEASGVLWGKVPDALMARLNGLEFVLPGEGWHKTGLYLDQQVNYQRVAERCAGASVLDCFSFLGGFSLHAARAGAASVLGLDQSAEAVSHAVANATRNGVADRTRFEVANVFDWLKAHAGPSRPVEETPAPREAFDVIILDPPSFTRNRASIPDALRGYKEIHLRALRLLKPGGMLATFCCSHHVDARLFEEVIRAAAFDARRVLRRVATYTQSPDHPVLPSIPETEYLKGYAYELAR